MIEVATSVENLVILLASVQKEVLEAVAGIHVEVEVVEASATSVASLATLLVTVVMEAA